MTKLTEWNLRLTLVLLCAATATAAHAQVFTKLLDFGQENGSSPIGYLMQGPDGNFYGLTAGGGSNGNYGTIFRVTAQGNLKTVYSFCGQPKCADGTSPTGGLILASDGNFYGATFEGGDLTCFAPYGCGTLFRVTPLGVLTTLHVFELGDGAFPTGSLVEAGGFLYGTTSGGGEVPCSPFNYGCGTVFRVTLEGSLTTLHTFSFGDGANSIAGLTQADDGAFFGTTQLGGNPNCFKSDSYGCGTVFKMTSDGALTTTYKFSVDGEPDAPLIQATDGNLYGTTGGEMTGSGTVFRVTPRGGVSTLTGFPGGGQSGVIPTGLTQGTDGNLYGPTFFGGPDTCQPPNGCGMLYQLTLAGVLTTLHNFGFADGAGAEGAMLQSTNGVFYGTTGDGGRSTGPCPSVGCGTIYSLDMGLGPFVTFVRPVGGIGQQAAILGQGLTGTTGVSFNGTAAIFSVRSNTFVTATVPAGAATGYVTVTTPTGTLQSNVQFHVLP